MKIWTLPGYTEIRELGKGGSGRVMLATHDQTGIPVAIKYLANDFTKDESFLREFRAEAQLLSELDSPYVTRMYEYFELDGQAAIVMELVDGVSMRAMIAEQGAVEPEAALVVLKGSLLGLADAHRSGVVHRDYKPANVLVDAAGHSKLADFGIAVRTGESGVPAGTPSYMAPEQWAGAPATPRTDIYAATATFFECLAGRPPYSAKTLDLLRHQHELEPVPVDLAPDAVRGLLERGLAKEPGKRPRDARAFLRELERVATDKYGAGWEAEGRKRLARRVALLAMLLPHPPHPTPPSASTAFAWTRLGKQSMALMALIIVLAGIVFGRVHPPGQSPTSWILPDSSISMPPTLVDPAVLPPSPSPSPSASPSPPPPSPAPSKSKPAKKPPLSPPPSPPAPSASASSAPPPPVPTFGFLGVQGTPDPNPCLSVACKIDWVANARAVGSGKATLTVAFYPMNSDQVRIGKVSASVTIDFTVTATGPLQRSNNADYSACGGQPYVQVQGSISVNGTTVITAVSQPVNCQIPVLR